MWGESYYNKKQESNKGRSMLDYIEEGEKKKKENDELCEDLKGSYIKLKYDSSKLALKYEKIKIGEREFQNINDIGGNEIRKDETIDKFIDFFKEIENQIENDYEQKNEFTLELEIKGDKNRISCNLDCLYKLTMHNNEQKQYRDFNILINGPSGGFQFLMDDLNNCK